MSLEAHARLGPYEIVAPLGGGGAWEAYRAWDEGLARDVVLKLLPAALAGDPEAFDRFKRRVMAIANLDHPNILGLQGVALEDGLWFATIPWLDGESVATRLVHAPIPVREALYLALQAARGLEAAHGKGILHGALKPSNLWLTRRGPLMILDFGFARPGEGYRSPEQASGGAADVRSDLYSLGVVLFEMVAGAPPFARERLENGPAGARAQRFHPNLRRLLDQCLAEDPAGRYQDARSLAHALETLDCETEPFPPLHGTLPGSP